MDPNVGGEMLGPFQEMWGKVIGYIPSFVAGLLILGLGLVICWLVKKAATRLVLLMRLDRVLAGVHWARAISRADVRHAVAGTAGTLLAAVVFLVFVENAVLVWRLEVLATLIGALVSYLPQLLIGTIMLLVGSITASGVSGRLRSALATEGIVRAALAARVVHWSIMVIVVAVVLEELEIAPRTVQTALRIGMGSLGLALVLAVGLGSREAVARVWRSILDARLRQE